MKTNGREKRMSRWNKLCDWSKRL